MKLTLIIIGLLLTVNCFACGGSASVQTTDTSPDVETETVTSDEG